MEYRNERMKFMTPIEKSHCKMLWNYLNINNPIVPSDVIIICGGHDLSVAREAVRLYQKQFAPLIVVSGGIEREIFGKSKKALEADFLGKIIIGDGVPAKDVIFEREAKNTGENLDYSEKLLDRLGIVFKSVIMIQKPYAGRRALYMAKKKWPSREIIIDSEKTTFEDYFNSDIPERKIINMMVGEIQRLIYSPKFGWMDAIEIPDDVLNSYKQLCIFGYTDRLMSDDVIRKCLNGTQDNISIDAK